jgi:flagellar M-ring protein FliF
VIEGGRVKRVSVAVLVDGTYTKNEKGESVYEPRSKEEIDRIAALVRSAIGFDQKRGDVVEVVNLRFAEQPAMPISEPTGWMSALQFTKDDVARGIQLMVMGLLGFVVVLFVVRPLVRRIVTPEEPKPLAGTELIPGTVGALAASDLDSTKAQQPSFAAKMIDIAQIQGEVHAQSVKKVGELADKNPEEAVAIIRHWLHEMPPA